MRGKHLPIELSKGEKELVLQYIQKFKRSPLSMKMLMCAYFGGEKFRDGYITIASYITESLRYADTREDKDESLKRYWHFNGDRNYTNFFGFSKDTILKGTMNDVEKMITDWLFAEREHRPIYYQSMWLTNV